MSRIYYRGAKAAIVCYDLTEESSFERAKFWIDELKANEENCFIFLCGTKLDLVQDGSHQRSVDMNRVKAEIHAEDYFDTSSKTGENIEELFQNIGEFYQGLKSTVNNANQDNIDLIGPSFTKKPGCCNSK